MMGSVRHYADVPPPGIPGIAGPVDLLDLAGQKSAVRGPPHPQGTVRAALGARL